MSKNKVLTAILSVLVILFVTVSPAGAVQYGQPDGEGHPFVGLVVFYADEDATQPLWRCTGTLIAPTVFLTAGHCAESFNAVRAQVYFQSDATGTGYPYTGGVLGEPISHPEWNGSLTIPNTHDVGVVILDAPVTDRGFAELATAGLLDSYGKQVGQQDKSFKVVGYGLQGVKPEYISLKERYVGWTKVVNLKSSLTDGYNIQLSSNPGHWSGGTCFGDSGGPIFLNDTNIVVAVNSFVLNENCKGSGFGFRVDTPGAREFLGNFVTLP
jgi:hypothetical protein